VPKAQTITVKARGLYDVRQSPWSVPDGALFEASNVEILADGVLTPRHGGDFYTTAANKYSFLVKFGDYVIGRRSTGTLAYTLDAVTWTDYAGSFPTLTAGTESAKSVFIPTTAGVYSTDTIANAPIAAGVTAALDLSAVVAGAGTAIANNTQVAYRAVFGRRDANNRVLLGTPSSRIVLKNTAGTTQNATVVVTIPTEVQSSTFFLQLYRTGASVDQNTDPGDECYLVYEAALSAVSTVTITDSTPDGLGGASLYTNPSQETILGGNERPPLAYDLAEFGGSLWYADTTIPARQTIYLLGVSGTNGLALNDTITINGQAFTAKAAETVASKEFLLATAGTVDENVRATTASLIKCVNRTAAANAFAIDLSEPYPAGIPGTISVQRTDKTSNLTLAVSRATAWANIVATTVPVRNQNGLMHSKTGQPDQIATAIYNAPILIGTAQEPIQRIIPTRNSLWVLKQDGVWRITGTAGQFDVQAFDPTVRIASAKTAVALDNQAYFLSDQGVVRVSESGVELISSRISKILNIPNNSNTASTLATAVARERRGQYVIWPQVSSGNYGLVYHILEDAWTSRDDGHGLANAPVAAIEIGDMAQLYIGGTTTGWIEHMISDSAPVGVAGSDVNMTTPGRLIGTTATVNPDGTVKLDFSSATGASGIAVGDEVIQDTSGACGRIISVGALTITVEPNRYTPLAFTSADMTLYRGLQTSVSYFVKAPAPGTLCEWTESVWLFANSSGGTSVTGFPRLSSTNIRGTASYTTDNGTSSVSVVRAPSGTPVENASIPTIATRVAGELRVSIGREASLGSSILANYSEKVAYGGTPDTLAGLVLTFSPQGDGVSR
jgi:hypothetical protein